MARWIPLVWACIAVLLWGALLGGILDALPGANINLGASFGLYNYAVVASALTFAAAGACAAWIALRRARGEAVSFALRMVPVTALAWLGLVSALMGQPIWLFRWTLFLWVPYLMVITMPVLVAAHVVAAVCCTLGPAVAAHIGKDAPR